MRRLYKVLILIIIIITLTGCSGNYNLVINKDLSITEELELDIQNQEGLYEKTLKIFESQNIDSKKYDVKKTDENIKVEYKDKFDSIEDYLLNSKVYHQIFEDIEYNKKSSYIDLYVNKDLKLKNKYNIINGSNLQDLDVIQINITNPFKVTISNADIENNKVYTWKITKDDTNKKIQMQFKPSLDEFPYQTIIVTSVVLIVSIILIIRVLKRMKNRQRL